MTRNYKLTARDKKLLELLHQYSLMSTNQIATLVFENIAKTTMLRRLRVLETNKLIQFIEYQKGRERVWVLTQLGAWEVNLEVPKKNYSHHIMDHDVKLVELRILLMRQEVIKKWIPEHEIRSQVIAKHGRSNINQRIIPDALLTIEKENINQAVALELEINFKNIDRYRKLFYSYRQKNNVDMVYYIVSTKGLGKHLDRIWNEQRMIVKGPMFMWSVYTDIVTNRLNAKVYCKEKVINLEKFLNVKQQIDNAQAMSMQSEQDKLNEKNLTCENNTLNLESVS